MKIEVQVQTPNPRYGSSSLILFIFCSQLESFFTRFIGKRKIFSQKKIFSNIAFKSRKVQVNKFFKSLAFASTFKWIWFFLGFRLQCISLNILMLMAALEGFWNAGLRRIGKIQLSRAPNNQIKISLNQTFQTIPKKRATLPHHQFQTPYWSYPNKDTIFMAIESHSHTQI